MASPNKLAEILASAEEASMKARSPWRYAEALGRAVPQVASAGLQGTGIGDEWLAALTAQRDPLNYVKTFKSDLAKIQAPGKQLEQETPGAATLAQISGGVGAAAIPVGGLAAKGGSLLAKTAIGAAEGAGIGGATGFGYGDTLKERTKNAKVGMLVGSAGGAAMAPLERGLSRAFGGPKELRSALEKYIPKSSALAEAEEILPRYKNIKEEIFKTPETVGEADDIIRSLKVSIGKTPQTLDTLGRKIISQLKKAGVKKENIHAEGSSLSGSQYVKIFDDDDNLLHTIRISDHALPSSYERMHSGESVTYLSNKGDLASHVQGLGFDDWPVAVSDALERAGVKRKTQEIADYGRLKQVQKMRSDFEASERKYASERSLKSDMDVIKNLSPEDLAKLKYRVFETSGKSAGNKMRDLRMKLGLHSGRLELANILKEMGV